MLRTSFNMVEGDDFMDKVIEQVFADKVSPQQQLAKVKHLADEVYRVKAKLDKLLAKAQKANDTLSDETYVEKKLLKQKQRIQDIQQMTCWVDIDITKLTVVDLAPMKKWCTQQTKTTQTSYKKWGCFMVFIRSPISYEASKRVARFMFANKDHAMLFKLTFGGSN